MQVYIVVRWQEGFYSSLTLEKVFANEHDAIEFAEQLNVENPKEMRATVIVEDVN